MPNNGYHNRNHISSVLAAMYAQLSTAGPGTVFTQPVSMLSMLFSAIIHDIEHPGLTNDFLINAEHEWALTYNDQSVAENHHVAKGFSILSSNDTNFLDNEHSDDSTSTEKKVRERHKLLTFEEWRRFRYIVIELVMATDMRNHFTILGNAQVLCKRYERVAEGANSRSILERIMSSSSNNEDRMTMMKVLMKFADLSHLSLRTPLMVRWTNSLQEEFFNQGDLERSLGFHVSFMMDRNTSDIFVESQPGFFDKIALPLYQTLCTLFSYDSERAFIFKQFKTNSQYWQQALYLHKMEKRS